MTRFDPRAEGHRATNYSHWFLTTTSYLVKYTYRCVRLVQSLMLEMVLEVVMQDHFTRVAW